MDYKCRKRISVGLFPEPKKILPFTISWSLVSKPSLNLSADLVHFGTGISRVGPQPDAINNLTTLTHPGITLIKLWGISYPYMHRITPTRQDRMRHPLGNAPPCALPSRQSVAPTLPSWGPRWEQGFSSLQCSWKPQSSSQMALGIHRVGKGLPCPDRTPGGSALGPQFTPRRTRSCSVPSMCSGPDCARPATTSLPSQ